MTREEIESMNVVRPYSFETDREEQWYNVGLEDGLEAAFSEVNGIKPFDIVLYKGKERGIVKSVAQRGCFVLFGIQSTAHLCKWEDISLE